MNQNVLTDSADKLSDWGIKVNSKRPVNLDITTIKLPLPAYISILHRVSGVFLFLGFGLLLYALEMSLASRSSFASLQEMLALPVARFVIWLVLSALIYHFIAGIKHLLMDVDIGDGKESGRFGAVLTLIVSFALIAATGVWLW